MTTRPNAYLLACLCERLHVKLYVEHDRDSALPYLPELRALIGTPPRGDISIVGAEGRAIYYELCGKTRLALRWRLWEIARMKLLYADIKKHAYKASTIRFMLQGRDRSVLEARKRIVRSLRRKLKR